MNWNRDIVSLKYKKCVHSKNHAVTKHFMRLLDVSWERNYILMFIRKMKRKNWKKKAKKLLSSHQSESIWTSTGL